MENIAALLDYFKKIQKSLDRPDLNLMKFRLVKKSRVDDLLVCTLSLLPDSFKATMKKRLKPDAFPSVSCYARLSKIMKKQFFLFPDYYIVHYAEASTMLKSIRMNLETDIKRLEAD